MLLIHHHPIISLPRSTYARRALPGQPKAPQGSVKTGAGFEIIINATPCQSPLWEGEMHSVSIYLLKPGISHCFLKSHTRIGKTQEENFVIQGSILTAKSGQFTSVYNCIFTWNLHSMILTSSTLHKCYMHHMSPPINHSYTITYVP